MMSIRPMMILAAAAASLSACGVTDLVSKNTIPDMPLLTAMQNEAHAEVPLNPSYRVVEVDVTVPQELTVSEANSYKPGEDIVWREDPLGDRHAQVDTIVTDALTAGTASLSGTRDVKLEVVVTRFHALTQRTRYTFGGTHDIQLVYAVRDAATGALLEPLRPAGFEINAAGGDKALAEEAQGLTQKVVISNALMSMIQAELNRPRAAES